ARARAFLETLSEWGDGCGDVLVAHAGFVRALEVVCGSGGWEEVMRKRIEYLRWACLRPTT
ncbi:MAG TPA: hypothetical protein VFQ61_31190, partial [Polyangiaceae bacterium]|nr:hypothetical protein [Polyangiaceae bacterium]